MISLNYKNDIPPLSIRRIVFSGVCPVLLMLFDYLGASVDLKKNSLKFIERHITYLSNRKLDTCSKLYFPGQF